MKKKQIKILVLGILISTISMTCISLGAEQLGFSKVKEVWFQAVKVNYNNFNLTNQLQPIVIDGITYLPLSKTMNTFNKNSNWNSLTKTITIVDKKDPVISDLESKIDMKEAEIKYLKTKIQTLKNVLQDIDTDNIHINDNNSDDKNDISKLEDELNDDYDEYYNVDLEYKLYEKNNKITVKIDVDDDDWKDKLTTSKRRKICDSICEKILKEYDDADIRGYVKHGSKTLTEFYTSFKNQVTIGSNDIGDFEDEMNEKLFDNDFGKLSNIDNDDLYIEVDGDKDDIIYYYISIDLNKYDTKWDNLRKSDIEDFMKQIYNEFKNENDFDDAYIKGYIYDIDEKEIVVKCYKANNKLVYSYK